MAANQLALQLMINPKQERSIVYRSFVVNGSEDNLVDFQSKSFVFSILVQENTYFLNCNFINLLCRRCLNLVYEIWKVKKR